MKYWKLYRTNQMLILLFFLLLGVHLLMRYRHFQEGLTNTKTATWNGETVVVVVGDIVKFDPVPGVSEKGNHPLCLGSKDECVGVPIKTNNSYTFKATEVGDFDYRCKNHPGMNGTIKVNAASSGGGKKQLSKSNTSGYKLTTAKRGRKSKRKKRRKSRGKSRRKRSRYRRRNKIKRVAL